MGRRYRCLLWVLATLGVGGGVASPPSSVASVSAAQPVGAVMEIRSASRAAIGRASWYGHAHHGRLTASGERYDMHALTAAHRSLPFGTRLRVTNLNNAEVVEVRINDRGPMVAGRILDLSYAAARRLGAVGAGVIPVSFTVLSEP